MWRWIKRIAIGLTALIVLLLVTVYVGSHSILTKEYPTQARTIELSENDRVIANGERLAQIYGCYGGCHGKEMEGNVFFEAPFVVRLVAPSLGTALQTHSLAELESIIRQGVQPDGRGVMGMPNNSFAAMTDQDLQAVLSFMASRDIDDAGLGKSSFGPIGRAFILKGDFRPSPENMTTTTPWTREQQQDPDSKGHYLATLTCSECHGDDLQGQEGFTPSLAIIQAYDRDQFGLLLSEGIGIGDRDLDLMSEVSKRRYSHFDDAEIDAIYTYLQSVH